MRKFLVGLAVAMAIAGQPAHAQQATAVSSCGGITYDTAGQPYPITQDLTGSLCTGVTVTVGNTNTTKVNSANVDVGQGAASTGTQRVAVASGDPCTAGAKSSAAISISTATTTSLVAVSGTKVVYVCGFSFSIAPSATAADTALLEYGTGASCTGTHALTGTYGDGDLTAAAPPLFVALGNGLGTVLTAPAANGVCLVSAGTAVSIQGQLTYVQQ